MEHILDTIIMDIERRALYNLIRMNSLNDPSMEVEPWQVEDYRAFSLKALFQRLSKLGLDLDQTSFMAYAEGAGSPEDLTDLFLEEADADPKEADEIYLHLFEIWRRLIPEKLCLSVFCDELDHQIYEYDMNGHQTTEEVQNVLAILQMILDENFDRGVNPIDIFDSVSLACANDLESFLYDFIAEQIDNENHSYASELLEGLSKYVSGSKWFDLLNVRMLEFSEPEDLPNALHKIVLKAVKEDNLAFNIEVISSLVQGGEKGDFSKMVRKTIPLLETEEEFQEVLSLCGDFFQCLDKDEEDREIQSLLSKRSGKEPDQKIEKNDPDIEKLLKIIR